MKTQFKTGIYNFNPDPNFNYQLNRTVMWSDGDVDEIKTVSHKINSAETWVAELTNLGDKAIKRNDTIRAIAYYRMAEFFDFDGSENKLALYRKAKQLFYEYYKVVFEQKIKRDYVPYENIQLPVWVSIPSKSPIDTIVIHGGNDSYMEEFLGVINYLYEQNIAVYLFEGPGQGEVLREHGMPFTHEWEKPVTAILNHYKLDDVTLIGISLGGMLAPRAAAFEKRVKRVVGWSIMASFYNVLFSIKTPSERKMINGIMKWKLKSLFNAIGRKQMKQSPLVAWGMSHGMYNMGVKTPYDYVEKVKKFQFLDVAPQIDQDFLLLATQNDHFIPLKMYKEEIDALTNVKSLTFRIFTKAENADNHCNAGNTELALRTIVDWIKAIKQ